MKNYHSGLYPIKSACLTPHAPLNKCSVLSTNDLTSSNLPLSTTLIKSTDSFKNTFNFSSNVSAPISEGATALKLENEVEEQAVNEVEQLDQTNNEVFSNITKSEETLIEEKQTEDEAEITNGLENFEIEEETPELFNSEVEENLSDESSAETKEADNLDEDDLEIPAFLRRQKN